MTPLLEKQASLAAEAVRTIDADIVLETPLEDLAEQLLEKYLIEPIRLDHERVTSSGAKDVTLNARSMWGGDLAVDGTRVELFIPFDGEAVLFDVQPSSYTFNRPQFEVRGSTVVVRYEARSPLDPAEARRALDEVVAEIDQYLGWQSPEVERWNEQLRRDLTQWLQDRRSKVLRDRDLDAFLDVPLVGRENPSRVFAVDPPKRPAGIAPRHHLRGPGFAPEPAISEEGFAEILSEIESVTTAVQRLPKTFESMPEESLRDVLLVVLNNRFGPATAETFSRHGKTDIFIPWGGNQGAVFIAECKWWKGPAALRNAIDQLLGYLTWRDTRAALIVFVKQGSPSEIADKSAATIRAHTSFKRVQTLKDRDTFTLAHPTDPSRELHLALLVIPVIF